MIFLVHYDRATGTLVDIQEFSSREKAADARSELELSLLDCEGLREIVLLEAESIETLKKTHSRYFNSLGDLARNRVDAFSQKGGS